MDAVLILNLRSVIAEAPFGYAQDGDRSAVFREVSLRDGRALRSPVGIA